MREAQQTARGPAFRRAVFAHIQTQSLAAAGENRTGDMITRLTGDTERAGEVFQSFAMLSLIRFVGVVFVSWTLLLIADWRIALLGLSTTEYVFSWPPVSIPMCGGWNGTPGSIAPHRQTISWRRCGEGRLSGFFFWGKF
jgi:ABC-type multidrug transport system fused ATPase/permease subunit